MGKFAIYRSISGISSHAFVLEKVANGSEDVTWIVGVTGPVVSAWVSVSVVIEGALSEELGRGPCGNTLEGLAWFSSQGKMGLGRWVDGGVEGT